MHWRLTSGTIDWNIYREGAARSSRLSVAYVGELNERLTKAIRRLGYVDREASEEKELLRAPVAFGDRSKLGGSAGWFFETAYAAKISGAIVARDRGWITIDGAIRFGDRLPAKRRCDHGHRSDFHDAFATTIR